jgi:hypothetical protein
MRIFIISAVLALGSVALWAAMPLPATRHVSTATSSPAVSKALSHCHTGQGIGRTCVSAFVDALVLEQPEHAVTTGADRACHADRRTFPWALPS